MPNALKKLIKSVWGHEMVFGCVPAYFHHYLVRSAEITALKWLIF